MGTSLHASLHTRRRLLRGSLSVTGLVLLTGCSHFQFRTQHPGKVPKVGVIGPAARLIAPRAEQEFRQGLHELGYVEGQNLAVEWRDVAGLPERITESLAELVTLPVDVLVVPIDGVRPGMQATSTLPIVCPTLPPEPVALGLVGSLARPGGNLTGLSVGVDGQLAGKRLQLLREAIPGASRVGALWHVEYAPNVEAHASLQDAAHALGLQLISLGVRGAGDLDAAFQAASDGRAEALAVSGGPLLNDQAPRIIELAARSRLPAIYTRPESARAGGLMAYGASAADLWRRAATYVDKILKGARPGDLPIELPMRFDFVINLKTARALGLTIPQTILIQATELIE